ncbi:carboxypeptidase regulatory-like domain-containing protein [Streptomyces sp. NBC_00448]|uniref:carboxypeptidase regulatory-like domain-containing protein n=1 Tax=Streptomyces sp. NBC_00448 TaxID=2903652 RepID=UPI002E221686
MAIPGAHSRQRLRRLLVVGAAAAMAVLTVQLPAQAAPPGTAPAPAAATTSKKTPHPSHRLCSHSTKPSQAACSALERDDVQQSKAQVAASADATPTGLGPTDLKAAYHLPSTAASAGQTVAVVDAYDDPSAETELATYRQQYGLPACTTANGCFTKIDQRGGTDYPAPNADWAGEIALDVQMISAVCPDCKIMLVETDSASMANLGAGVNQAVAKGAKFVSNSYGAPEDASAPQSDAQYYDHPGVVITASSGDDGYGVNYPAASPLVTAVGGTSLVRDSSARGWSESAWSDAGSGCSKFEAKPSVQTDSGCAGRTVADVSAIADPDTGVAVFSGSTWHVFGGTSVSSPIIASVYALAGVPAAGSYPMTFPYARQSALHDVTSGSNGSCGGGYLCTGGDGYDGPTGLGTPDGVSAFAAGPHATVKGTITDGATGAPLAGALVTAGDAQATTAADGTYTVVVDPGTYDITATKFGYAAKTFPGVALVDGQTLTEDAALAAKARVAVTGTVADASGHGWPLYATVQVKGEPTSAVHTDPATGRYTLSVPVDGSYTLQTAAAYPGYAPNETSVAVGDGNVTRNIGVPVDAGCTAAGYTSHSHGGTEDFSSAAGATPPSGWTVSDADGTGQTWRFDSSRGNSTTGSGQYAMVDSRTYGSGGKQDTSLVSPVYDLSALPDPYLTFQTWYEGYSNSTADVDLSLDGGTTWATVNHWADTADRGHTVRIDLPQAAGQSNVRVRFRYTGAYSYYWEVDNVFVGGPTCDPVPGDLVLGQVTDANTGKAVTGAKVVSTDKPTEYASTAATPDDAALGDGFFWFFSTLTGTHPLSVTSGQYKTATASLDLAADQANDTNVALAAGQLSVSSTGVAKTLNWQGNASQTVTVKNTGTAAATVQLDEGDRGFTMQGRPAGAPVHEVEGHYRPGFIAPARHPAASAASTATATPAAAPWTTLANLPVAVMDNAVATAPDGKVYSVDGLSATAVVSTAYVYDPQTTTWSAVADTGVPREAPQSAFINGKLYVTGGWAADGSAVRGTQVYDPSAGTWTAVASIPSGFAGAGSAVLGGKWYIVGGCTATCGQRTVQVYDPAADTWTKIADYPEATAWLGCGAIGKALYCAGGDDSTTASVHTYSYDPATDAWSPLADMPFDLWGMGVTSSGGKLLLSGGVTNQTTTLTNKGISYDPLTGAWTALPNSNTTLYRAGSACGFYKVGGSNGNYQPIGSVEVLPGYGDCADAVDVPWLSADPASVTLAPGKSAKITVTLDASGAEINQPGTYDAALEIRQDTPYPVAPIDVAMTVLPPKTWGKITGTVTGALCSAAPAPLKGATVQIDSWAGSYTLKTDANGRYQLWLDVRNNPLTVTAAQDGWAPHPDQAKVRRGATTTLDFALHPDHTCS